MEPPEFRTEDHPHFELQELDVKHAVELIKLCSSINLDNFGFLPKGKNFRINCVKSKAWWNIVVNCIIPPDNKYMDSYIITPEHELKYSSTTVIE